MFIVKIILIICVTTIMAELICRFAEGGKA